MVLQFHQILSDIITIYFPDRVKAAPEWGVTISPNIIRCYHNILFSDRVKAASEWGGNFTNNPTK